MELLFTCLIVLLIMKFVFNVSVSVLKVVFAIMFFVVIIPIIPIGLAIIGLAIPLIIIVSLIAFIGFVLKVIF